MISYELAKKLKDAGFPQFTWDTLRPKQGHIGFPSSRQDRVLSVNNQDTNRLLAMIVENGENPKDVCVYIPTLSELIGACGDPRNGTGFLMLAYTGHISGDIWVAEGRRIEENGAVLPLIARGSTPEEAVANLWLALNPKHEE